MSHPGRSLSPGKTQYALHKRLDGPQGQSGQVRKISPPLGFNPQTIQPVASHCTDYVTWPTLLPLPFTLFFRRYFITDQALNEHFRTKVHKRRLKALELEPYTIEESERAAGKGSYLAPKKRKIETQTPVDETEQKSQDVNMN